MSGVDDGPGMAARNGAGPAGDGAATGDASEIEALEADIARTREELALTVDQLAAKLDVKSRAQDKVAQLQQRALSEVRSLRERATDADGKPRGAVLAGAGGLAAGLAAVVLVGLWRRSARSPAATPVRDCGRRAARARAAVRAAQAARAHAQAAQETAAAAKVSADAARSAATA